MGAIMINRNRRIAPSARRRASIASFIALCLFASPAIAKQTLQLLVQPGEGQVANMLHGVEMIVSRGSASEVRLLTPEPTEDGRMQIIFLFVNRSNAPVNIGPENVSATALAVVPYEKLIEEQRRHEGHKKFGNFLARLGTALSAADAGNSYGSYHFSGSTSYGDSFSGSGGVVIHDPYRAAQAEAQARAENTARTERMYQTFAAERQGLGYNLRITTVMPGQQLQGVITFDAPQALRKASSYQPFTIAVQIGGDRHLMNGFVGPSGTLPTITAPPMTIATAPDAAPVAESARPSSYPTPARVQSPAITTAAYVRPSTASSGQVSVEAYRRGEYAGQSDRIAAVAKLGFAPAQNELGTMYQLGQGVTQDNAEAVRLFNLAATQGFRDAFTNLAWMYEKGQGVPKNLGIAEHYYNVAATQGDQLAADRLRALQRGG